MTITKHNKRTIKILKHMNNTVKHSILSPSSAFRNTSCPASFLANQPTEYGIETLTNETPAAALGIGTTPSAGSIRSHCKVQKYSLIRPAALISW